MDTNLALHSSPSMATATTNSGDENGDATVVKARQHIEDLRKNKFSIGDSKQNPLTQDLHAAVTSLSAELYTKDVHFLMELIQNAEDNKYSTAVEPALEFVLTTKDITGSGAPATLLVFNNEVGFSPKNMDSICSVGRSTKKGLRNNGFIGEKGIGFKSVFLVSAQPHIFSNGYQVKFNELPTEECGVGYIVPEWVSYNPTVEDIRGVYGEDKILPATTIILPLKPDKVEAVKKQLSEVHPEVLLFLTKIKQLSICENDFDSPGMDSVSSVAIASDTSLISLKNETADSRIVQLSVEEGAVLNESTCRYFIWRQTFHVKPDCLVNGRNNVKEWEISLAFPFGKRLKRGTSSVGIFAFLPTAMVTNFPFIIQADFILASSRETILLDSKWNLGILECVPLCFTNALTSCVKSFEASKFFPVASMLLFLPVRESSYKKLNTLRESIKTIVKDECIIPCESFTKNQKTLCQPKEALRIFPDFRTILLRIKRLGIELNGISSLGKFVLHSEVDLKKYDEALNFVGVSPVTESYPWYGKCVNACKLIMHVRLPLEVYMDFLCFFCNVGGPLQYDYVKDIPLIIYATGEKLALCSVSEIKMARYKIYLVLDFEKHNWLSVWNIGMQCPNGTFFMASYIVRALLEHKRRPDLEKWLKNTVGVVFTTISEYCSSIKRSVELSKNQKLAVSVAHLVYHANLKQYMHSNETASILWSLPIVDGSGKIHSYRTRILVPASGSKWVKLFGLNHFFRAQCTGSDKIIDMGDVYAEAADFGFDTTKNKELSTFLVKHTHAIDLPNIPPLNMELDVASSELTKDQALLLLDWIHCLRGKAHAVMLLPSRFIGSIANGSWLKTYSGFHSPNKCCLCDDDEEITHLIRNVREHFPIVDQQFYDGKIKSYTDELKVIGVTNGIEHMHVLVIRHLQNHALFTMSKDWAIFLLHFIKILKDKFMLKEDLVNAAKKAEWLKSNRGYSTPDGSIFLSSNDEAILQITDLHIIDAQFYEGKLESFNAELELLGVVVSLEGSNLNVVAQNFKFPQNVNTLKKSNILLILRCIRHLGDASNVFTEKLKVRPWIKTSYGFRRPSECVLTGKKWAHLSNTIPLPLIDESVYGSQLKKYKEELKTIGVVADHDGITRLLFDQVETLVSSLSLTSNHVISVLDFIKCMSKEMPSQLMELKTRLLEVKWLRTIQGYKSATDSVLFDSKWGTVVQFVDLPLIDEVFYGININLYRDQLKLLGVVVDFTEGAHFVAKGLRVPEEASFMSADTGLSLLECVSTLRMSPPNQHFYEELLNKLKVSKWLKTHLGYRSPEDALFFESEWESGLEKYDAPFIDEKFYSNFASVEKADFKAIGVKVDIEQVCSGVYEMLSSHAQTSVIFRIYRFLDKFNWSRRSQDGCSPQIWIPDAGIGGRWVDSRVCVLHDKGNLFHLRLHSLDKYYDNELLLFFKSAFEVAEAPSVNDYITLWKGWVSSMHEVSSSECTFFWRTISEQWNSTIAEILKQEIIVLPATILSGEGIHFVDKSKLFIPDDLQLKKLFSNVTTKPLFVWYPQDNSSYLSQSNLFDIYSSLGVKKISQSVQVETSCALPVGCKSEVVDVDSKDLLIGKHLMKIVLGFLASNRMNMPVEARHKTAKTLLGVTVVVTGKPIEMKYILKTCSAEQVLSVSVKRMVMWDKSSGRLIVKAASWDKQRNNIEFVTDFARTISEGLLPGNIELVDNLCKIIQMGFVFGFKKEAVDFLLMTENLELSSADRDFLNHAFAPVYHQTSSLRSEPDIIILDSLSTPEIPTRKRKTWEYISD